MTITIFLQILGIIVGSSALFTFIQFLIQRHDTIEQKEEENEINTLRNEIKQHLSDVNQNWKETYCDRNFRMIEELSEEMKKGITAQQEWGFKHYNEHEESIKKLNEAILQLTKNDTEIKEYIKYVGDEIMGLAHDKLVYLTDHYQARGAITLKEKSTLEAIYRPYAEGLGGNGDGKTGFEYAMQLPVVSDEKARKMDRDLQIDKYSKRNS